MSLEADIQKMVESIGLRFYDAVIVTENDEAIYRISVTSPNGVSLDQCVKATHLISPLLDVTPPMSGAYRLEVSSPGIERRLKTLLHFENSVGEKASITTLDKTKYRGELLRVMEDTIVIQDEEAGETAIPFSNISKGKTYFEW